MWLRNYRLNFVADKLHDWNASPVHYLILHPLKQVLCTRFKPLHNLKPTQLPHPAPKTRFNVSNIATRNASSLAIKRYKSSSFFRSLDITSSNICRNAMSAF